MLDRAVPHTLSYYATRQKFGPITYWPKKQAHYANTPTYHPHPYLQIDTWCISSYTWILRKSIEYLIIFRAYYVLITAAGFKTSCVYTHVFLRIHLLASSEGSGFIVLLRTATADLLHRQIGLGLWRRTTKIITHVENNFLCPTLLIQLRSLFILQHFQFLSWAYHGKMVL